MKYIIDKSDGKTENHPYFKDLVSSLSVFNNQKKSDIELEEGDTLPDDSDFTFLKNVEDYLKIWIENPTKEILVDCLVPDELNLTTKRSLDPELELPSKAPSVRPVT